MINSTKIGRNLESEFITTREQVETAPCNREATGKLKLGEMLREEGQISNAQLAHALERQAGADRAPLRNILIQMGLVDSFVVRRALLRKLGIPYVNVLKFHLEPVVVNAIHEEFMHAPNAALVSQ